MEAVEALNQKEGSHAFRTARRGYISLLYIQAILPPSVLHRWEMNAKIEVFRSLLFMITGDPIYYTVTSPPTRPIIEKIDADLIRKQDTHESILAEVEHRTGLKLEA